MNVFRNFQLSNQIFLLKIFNNIQFLDYNSSSPRIDIISRNIWDYKLVSKFISTGEIRKTKTDVTKSFISHALQKYNSKHQIK